MSFYPPETRGRSRLPSNAGEARDANSQGISASFLCGSSAKISLRIDEEAAVIGEAKFTTNGCGFMVAAADALASWLEDRELSALHGLPENELRETVARVLGKIPGDRTQCLTVVFEALRAALAEYRIRRVEEFRGEKALICTCFGITEDTIVETIERNDVEDVASVTAISRAGSGCGSCRMLIAELIDARRRY